MNDLTEIIKQQSLTILKLNNKINELNNTIKQFEKKSKPKLKNNNLQLPKGKG